MKVIKIKAEEIQFLRELNNSIISYYLDEAHLETKSSALILTLSKNDLEKICDELAYILTRDGITNSEINNFGKKIDDFIGRFNHYE